MVNMLTPSALDCEFETQYGEAIDYNISICCFFTKHTTLSSNRKYCFSQNQDNVSESSDKSTYELV